MASMNEKSMFAIYLYEDRDGNISIRADSYGQGDKALRLGMSMVEALDRLLEGTEIYYLPIDRCEHVQ